MSVGCWRSVLSNTARGKYLFSSNPQLYLSAEERERIVDDKQTSDTERSLMERRHVPTVFGSDIGVCAVTFRQTVANMHDTSRPALTQSLLNTLTFEGSKFTLIPTRTTLRDLFRNTEARQELNEFTISDF